MRVALLLVPWWAGAAAAPTCCFVKYGDETTCGSFSGSPGQGLCNTDWTKTCTLDSDCPSTLPPTPSPTPTPTPPAGGCHQRDGQFDGPACGYACDDNCNCGHCNNKPGCMTNDTCLGPCNSGKNAKWCPGGPAPSPPSPPSPSPPTPPPAPPSTSSGNYPVDKLQFAGRWYAGKTAAFPTDGMVTSWGQSFFAKFTGSAHVGVKLNGGGLYYTYRIDGGPWTKITGASGTVHLADNLAKEEEHTLHFGRSDEASYGYMTFNDLVLDAGYTALVPDKPKLTYEALGDSITAGFKVNGPPSTANEDVYETYVAHLADAWGTDDWHTVARSGIGVANVRGSGGSMLEEYKCRAYVDLGSWNCHFTPSMGGEHQWDFALESRVPDVVTVNLGTNDFAFGTGIGFQTDYTSFVRFVRSKRPNATIFCLCPLQYSCSADGSTKGLKWKTMRDGVAGAVKTLNDPKIVYVPTGSFDDPWLDCATEYSDYTHPTVAGHAKFAERLKEVLTPIVLQNHLLAEPGFLV